MAITVRKAGLTTLKILLAAGLLGWVLSGVHWRDYVKVDGSSAEYEVLKAEPDTSAANSLVLRQGKLWWAKDVSASRSGEGWQLADGGAPVRFAVVPNSEQFIRQGFVSTLWHMNKLLLGLACAGFVCSVLVTAVRWWFLLRLVDVHIRVWEAIRLTFLGQFFNTVVPGTVGGDLVKAYYAAKHTPRKAATLVSIFVDRVLGLTELTFLAGVMLTVVLVSGMAKFGDLGWPALTVAVVVVLVAGFFSLLLSAGLRRALRLEKLYSRLPIAHHFEAAGQAAAMYRNRIGSLVKAVAITFGGHIIWIGSIGLIGMSLGLDTPWYNYFLYVPLIYIIGAVPISPGGVGLVEALYVSFLATSATVAPTQVLALALLARLIPVFWSLPGALVAIAGPALPKADAMQAELEGADAPPQEPAQSAAN